jgi:hypothetical protein
MDRIWLDRTRAFALALLATTILFAINYFESAFPRPYGGGSNEPCHAPPGWFCVVM